MNGSQSEGRPAARLRSSEAERRRWARETGGRPRTEFPDGSTPFAEYAQMDSLLALAAPVTDAETEFCFIVMSQVKELLFNLLFEEFARAREQLASDGLDAALWTLRRARRIQRCTLSAWDVLASMTPGEFAEFRDALGSASGFQSMSYRKLEFVLGNKDVRMTRPHAHSPGYADILEQLHSPSLWDAVLALLDRRGFGIASSVLGRDPAQSYESDASVEDAWRSIYQAPDRHRDLVTLGESLTDTADLFARWRHTHLLVVQRMLGSKPGTGGTHGVAWLEGIVQHRFFPELWLVRSQL